MTINAIENTAAPTVANIWGLIATLLDKIADYRKTRKANKPSPFYHNDKAQRLERARRDVNRLWQHHF